MTKNNEHAVIIIGGGPAGLATALHLAQVAPDIAANTRIIEARSHPRPKLCGGGVTFHGEEQLDNLGIHIDANAFSIDRIIFRLAEREFSVEHEKAMRIFDRSAFDAALADAAVERGVTMQMGTRLLDIRQNGKGFVLETDQGDYHAAVVVGADGANSTVRRKLKFERAEGVARLLRVITPADPETDPIWQERTAIFDFTCIRRDVQGYMWDFPTYFGGKPVINRGIFDSRIAPDVDTPKIHGNFKKAFAAGLNDRSIDLDALELEGHPVRWFNPEGEFSRPRVLMVGDAAGVDPLFAEGISYAMEYGSIAAQTIADGFTRDDFGFTGYRERILDHRLGKLLLRRAAVARSLYRHRYPPAWSLLWMLADIAPKRVQRAMGASLALLPP